jgi:murein DD-endopeptidase MepM/ murein hydrolase activator NlpD
MIDPPTEIDERPVCDLCQDSLDREQYVQMVESSLWVFCSGECVSVASLERRRWRSAARRRYGRRLTIVVILVGGFLTPHGGPPGKPLVTRAPAPKSIDESGLTPLPPGWFGPDWPPTEVSLLAALGRDTWVHPLAGPWRRMPRSDSRVFGAVRPGERPIECRNGHCGVDLGGEIWGEHVRAVHDGVVDWVQRGPNTEHGGEFVRIAHRNGTVFTQYFHLAAIPRALERGMPVKGGDLIGLLGDTGVKQSAPHLHFALSIRSSKDGPERYVDPEPLIALWPLRVPIEGTEVGLVTTLGQVGVPLGSAPGRKLAKKNRVSDGTVKHPKDRSQGRSASSAREDPTSETTTPEPSGEEFVPEGSPSDEPSLGE